MTYKLTKTQFNNYKYYKKINNGLNYLYRFKQYRSKGGKKMLEFLANLLSGAATASTATPYTPWFIFDEPECPEKYYKIYHCFY